MPRLITVDFTGVESGGGERDALAQKSFRLLQHHEDVEIVQSGPGDALESPREMTARHIERPRQSFRIAAHALASRQHFDRPSDQPLVVARAVEQVRSHAPVRKQA